MFVLLFIITVIPIAFSVIKVFRREDLNIFDITIIFSALYFWAIPLQDFIFNHLRPFYLEHTSTVIALIIYMYGLGTLAKVCSLYKNSPLNITERFSIIHIRKIKDSFQWFALIYITFMFWNITNYSALSESNIEGNNNFFYGTNQGFVMRIISLSFKTFFPVIFLMLFENSPERLVYKILRKINLIILIASLLLGEKTFMVFNLTFLLLYLYSTRRYKLSNKKIIILSTVLIVFLIAFFPLSQAFRLYKQKAVARTGGHSFVEVVSGFITDGIDPNLENKVERYQKGRSLNLYDALDWAATRTDYRGNGKLSSIVLRYIIPQKVGTDGNIMGDLMSGSGVDIGESTLSWYVLDWGIILGPIVALLHILLLYLAIYYFGMIFYRYIKSPIYPLVVYSFLMRFAISIEHNPALDIKMFYNTYYLVILFTGVILYIFNEKHEKTIA